jgi:signal transduction histidine kinase
MTTPAQRLPERARRGGRRAAAQRLPERARGASRRVPWSPRAWAQAVYLAGAIPAQLVAVAVPAILLYWLTGLRLVVAQDGYAALIWAIWKWQYLPAWLLALVVLMFALPALTGIHRHRLRVTAGVEIPRQPAVLKRLSLRAVVAAVQSRATRRQLGYHLLAGPALAVAEVTVLGVWLAGVLYSLVYFYAWALPHSGLLWRGQGQFGRLASWLPGVPADVYLTGAGIALLIAAPRLTGAVAALDARAARSLLGPSRTEELEHRVEHLAQTRAGVVDAADAERRRLERDLHDGTQQRLVALAMNLGLARAQASTAEQAQQAIAEAHEDAKAALTELRNLIRGLHPAVLEDRGLDAALSGVVARLPVPVRLTVDLPRRPPPVIEAVAYFVVSEALANVAKHAQASQAQVFVQRSGDRLHVIVSDDGVGGADPERGTGLAGLAKRASSVDGHFEINSPPGGPTVLTVDLPCAR